MNPLLGDDFDGLSGHDFSHAANAAKAVRL